MEITEFIVLFIIIICFGVLLGVVGGIVTADKIIKAERAKCFELLDKCKGLYEECTYIYKGDGQTWEPLNVSLNLSLT